MIVVIFTWEEASMALWDCLNSLVANAGRPRVAPRFGSLRRHELRSMMAHQFACDVRRYLDSLCVTNPDVEHSQLWELPKLGKL
eukprot:2407908-Pleurochrysis_carterae.AAC.1